MHSRLQNWFCPKAAEAPTDVDAKFQCWHHMPPQGFTSGGFNRCKTPGCIWGSSTIVSPDSITIQWKSGWWMYKFPSWYSDLFDMWCRSIGGCIRATKSQVYTSSKLKESVIFFLIFPLRLNFFSTYWIWIRLY